MLNAAFDFSGVHIFMLAYIPVKCLLNSLFLHLSVSPSVSLCACSSPTVLLSLCAPVAVRQPMNQFHEIWYRTILQELSLQCVQCNFTVTKSYSVFDRLRVQNTGADRLCQRWVYHVQRFPKFPVRSTSIFIAFQLIYSNTRMGRDSSVSTATRYGLDGPAIESRWGARFSAPFQTGPGAHPASYTMGTGSFPGVKWPGRGRWPPNPI